jgi:hypothetical protein
MGSFDGVKVFSTTLARDREQMGENITRWRPAAPASPPTWPTSWPGAAAGWPSARPASAAARGWR